MMRVKKLTTRLHRGLCIMLAMLMVVALIPIGVFAADDWDDAFQKEKKEKIEALQKEVTSYANIKLADALAFSFTGYTLSEEIDLSGETEYTPETLPTGDLSVTVTRSTGEASVEDAGEVAPAEPVVITLPAGAYAVELSTLADGQYIKDMSGLSADAPLVISADGITEVSYTLTSEAPAPAAPDLNRFITSMTLSVNDGEAVELTPDTSLELKVDDKIKVTGTFVIHDPFVGAGFRNETPYAIDLPQALSYASDASSDVIDKTGNKAGVFSLSMKDKTASFTFSKDYLHQNVSSVKGEFSYDGSVKPGPDVDGDDVSFSVGGEIIKVPIIHEVPQADVTKSGKVLDNTDSALTRWTVNIQSPEKVFPAGLTVTDKMSLASDSKPIHQLREVESVKIDNKVVPQNDYTVDALAGDGFALTLNKAYDGSKMTIMFTSNLSQDGLKTLIEKDGTSGDNKVYTYSVHNEVSVTSASQEGGEGGADWGEANATVNNNLARLIKKTYVKQEVGDDGANYQVWQILVNQPFMDLEAGTVITDILPDGLDFVSATAYIYTGKNGSYTKPSDFSQHYTKDDNLIRTDSSAVTFTLNRDINVPMVIEVKTKAAEDFIGKNKATMEWNGSTFTAEATAGKQFSSPIYKTGSDFNLTTRSARWNIYVGGLTGTATLSDKLQQQTLIAADADLQADFQDVDKKYIVIQRLSNPSVAHVKANGAKETVGEPIYLDLASGNNSKTIAGTDGGSVTFTASYDSNTNTLKVQMEPTGAEKHVYQISFYTRVSDKVIHKNSTPGPESMRQVATATIKNTAKLTIDGTTHSGDATQSKEEKTFDKVGGTYNWVDRTVTWTIKANMNSLPYKANTFQIIDQLPKGLEYVKDGITVTVGGSDMEDLGYESVYSFSEDGTRLTISITHPTNKGAFNLPVNVKIVTRLTDDGIDLLYGLNKDTGEYTYPGTYTFQNKGYQCGTDLDGTARWYGDWHDLTLKGVPVEKDADYQEDSASILWTVQINPKHLAVITPGQGQDITDMMSVKGLPDSLNSYDLVGFEHERLTLSRIPQNGSSGGNPIDGKPEVLTLTNVAPGEQPPAQGSYYSFNAEKLTLNLHIDTTGHKVNDKYTITYLTPLSVPDNYKGTESIRVENGIEWSGHKKTETSGDISLASVKASLSTKNFTVLTVHKKDGANNEPLSGAAFTLYRLEADGNRTPVGSGVTKADGSLVFNRLKKEATYVLVETSAPKGYAVSAQAGEGIKVVIPNEGDFIEETVTNEPINSSVKITKTDAETAAPLAGVEFTLYAAGAEKPFAQAGLTNPALTGQDGVVTFDKLPLGSYVVRETGGLPGYVVEAKELTVEIKAANDVIQETVTNQLIHGGVQITKVEAGSPEQKLQGAEFTLYQKGAETPYQYDGLVNPASTGPDGVVTFANLPVGSYIVRETKAPDGYRLGQTPWEQEVSVETHNEIYSYTVENQPVVGKLIVTKMGASTDGTVLLTGAKFELLAEDKTTVVGAEQETNERGQIIFEGLRVGTYYLRETAAPNGYVLSTELHEVQITDAKAEIYLNVTNIKTPPIDVPVDVPDTQPPIVDRDDNDNDDDDDNRRPIRVVDPTDLTPEEVETLIEDGFTPLSDIPDLTPEMIIDQQIPLADFPEEEIPLAMQPGIPVTGDNTPVTLMAVVLFGSVAGLLALNWKPRRKK